MKSVINRFPLKYVFIVFGLLIYLFHFVERDPSSPYQRPIVSDAKGYYAYLPAIFIYQDFEYEFLSKMDQEYYAVGYDKHIFIEQNGHRVNKTFPGVALLYLPFFLIAHVIALLGGFPADGYSDIYQYLFDFGQFFYATLGMIFLGKILTILKFSKRTVFVSVLSLFLGTNLWFYTAYDQSVTHVYNFFLISLLIFIAIKLNEKITYKRWIGFVLTVSLLMIIRPTNFLSLILIPFFIPEFSFYERLFKKILNWKVLLSTFFSSVLVFLFPLLLWKVQSGHWLVYSYGKEGFDFANPQIFNFLFSYAKGWFLYSPLILFVIILGVRYLFKDKRSGKKRILFLGVFLALSIYVFSSWWCWWYGFSFGQRPMVDFYVLIGFLLAFILKEIQFSRFSQMAFGSVVIFCIFLNILQSHQHHHGFFQWSKPNKEIYWDNFLRFDKQAKVYTEVGWTLLETKTYNFETSNVEVFGKVLESENANSGKFAIVNDESNSFSANIKAKLDKLDKNSFVIISFKVMSASDLSNTDLVMQYGQDANTYINFNFNEFAIPHKWVTIELKYDKIPSSDTLSIYFWNKDSGEKAIYDDVMLEVYKR